MATSPDGLFEMNDTHIEQFYRDGYFVAPRLIDRETVENVINDFESQGETVDPSGEWKATGFTHFSSHAETYPRVAQFLQSERLVDMMECLFRSPARLWLGMYAVVRPKGGRGLAWHQDNQYTHILGPALNAFIALDTITEKNAGLWIAPQSHLLGRQPNINEGEGHRRAADPENGQPCPDMAPGDAVFFHRETLHRSGENHTANVRRAFAFQVASDACHYAESGKPIVNRQLLRSVSSS